MTTTATDVTFLTVALSICSRQAAARQVIRGALTEESNDLLPVPVGSTLNTLVILNRRLGWLPSVGGNKAALFSDYDEAIAAMADAVRAAERYVHVEFYIVGPSI
jgi:phosphatidylserine/phosphatidylglycerophosphate/cardiolipin synthase-like enzyme